MPYMNIGYQLLRKRRIKMAISTIRAEFPCEIEKIWSIVTSLEDYSWRSDIDKIIATDDRLYIADFSLTQNVFIFDCSIPWQTSTLL